MSVIKLITKSDSDSFIGLTRRLSTYYNGEITPKKLDEITSRSLEYIENNTAFGYFIEDKLVGYITIRFFDKDHHNFPNSIFISELFVIEDLRGQYIGRDLVKYILEKDFDKNYTYFSVAHSPKEIRLTEFYERLGFKYDRVLKSGNIALLKDIE